MARNVKTDVAKVELRPLVEPQIVLEHSPVGESQSNGRVENAIGRVKDQMRALKLDIEAGSPLLILPMSSNSPDIVAVDLGSLTICNKFLFSGDEGTISSVSLSSAEAGDVLGSRRSRAMSGSSRSSVRSRSSAKSPVSVRSGGRRMRMGRGPGSGRTHKSQLQRCASDRAWRFRNVLFHDLQILLRQ